MPRQSLWSVTRRVNADGDLALFVGAGISMGCGLPSWKECVARVVAAAWRNQPDLAHQLISSGNILAARYARKKAGKSFNRLVHQALYQDAVELSDCVKAIAKSGIRLICNFNFDDLVAEALQVEGVQSHIVAPGESFDSTKRGIIVYHPHGCIPRFHAEGELDSARIIFSEDDYHSLYSEPNSWANVLQLSLLTSKSVLFAGLSMQDPNLRRLIDITRSRGFTNQHFAVFRDPTVGKPKHVRVELQRLKDLIETDMRSLGITPWFVGTHEKIAEIFENLRSKA